jgi:hypothetical protein
MQTIVMPGILPPGSINSMTTARVLSSCSTLVDRLLTGFSICKQPEMPMDISSRSFLNTDSINTGLIRCRVLENRSNVIFQSGKFLVYMLIGIITLGKRMLMKSITSKDIWLTVLPGWMKTFRAIVFLQWQKIYIW